MLRSSDILILPTRLSLLILTSYSNKNRSVFEVIELTVAITTGGGSKSLSSLMTLIFSILSHAASILHQDTLARTFSGFFISSQHGPLILRSRRKVSSEGVVAPKMWEKVRYFLFVGGGGNVAWNKEFLFKVSFYWLSELNLDFRFMKPWI